MKEQQQTNYPNTTLGCIVEKNVFMTAVPQLFFLNVPDVKFSSYLTLC